MERSKVVVVMGATATGKTRLAVDLALRLGGEVVNADKIQVYDGLAVATNKATAAECAGVPHHLIGGVHPDADYTVADFSRDATGAVGSILARGRLPIMAGGSNTYLEALLDGDPGFRRQHECCFLWVDADMPVLHQYARARVEQMVEQGLVDEVRELFRPDADYSRGIRRAIGVPEMDQYFRLDDDDKRSAQVLAAAVDEIKANTCRLACRQQRKIVRLRGLPGWNLRRVDSTAVLRLKVGQVRDVGQEPAVWETAVAGPAVRAVEVFLGGDDDGGERVVAGTVGEHCGVPVDSAVTGRGFVPLEAAV